MRNFNTLLTMECATCHDHKFDPISQKEYYQLSAFFNNLKELGMVVEIKHQQPYAGTLLRHQKGMKLKCGVTENRHVPSVTLMTV